MSYIPKPLTIPSNRKRASKRKGPSRLWLELRGAVPVKGVVGVQ